MSVVLRNAATGVVIATRVERAGTWLKRAVGLLGRDRIEPDDGLWLAPCDAIHTIGMRTAIDLIFVDVNDAVMRVFPDVRPNRPAVTCQGAAAAIELGAGALHRADVLTGDRLELVEG